MGDERTNCVLITGAKFVCQFMLRNRTSILDRTVFFLVSLVLKYTLNLNHRLNEKYNHTFLVDVNTLS